MKEMARQRARVLANTLTDGFLMGFSRFFTLFFLSAGICLCQSIAPDSDEEVNLSDESSVLDFPLLKEVERRKKFIEQEQFEQKRQIQYEELRSLLQQASQSNDPDVRILNYLQAQQRIRRMWEEKEDARLKRLNAYTQKAILGLPPPRFFVDSSGLEMVFVDAKPEPFYMSRTPITRNQFSLYRSSAQYLALREKYSMKEDFAHVGTLQGNSLMDGTLTQVDWHTALDFSNWLTSFSRYKYQLPTLAQLQQCKNIGSFALWTRDSWAGPDLQAEQIRKRFGVRMYVIWDPQQKISGTSIFGQLPFARHPELTFYVVCDWRIGVRERLARLKKQL